MTPATTECSPIEERIQRADRLRSRLGDGLDGDQEGRRLLCAYRHAIEATARVMRQSGMVEACAICGSGPSGGCCFEGVEQWYDEVLLFINRLLGVHLSARRRIPGRCYFLGSDGCALLARHSFCINYLCYGLDASLSEEQQRTFLSTAGAEILAGWELERHLRGRLGAVDYGLQTVVEEVVVPIPGVRLAVFTGPAPRAFAPSPPPRTGNWKNRSALS